MKKAFVLAASLLLAPIAWAHDFVASPDPVENAAREEFSGRMGAFNDKGDWPALLQSGIEWQQLHPTDPNGWYTTAWASYNLGDVDTAIRDYAKADQMEPPTQPNQLLDNARKARAHYPNLKLKPLQFVGGDASKQESEWQDKGIALLAAKRYDEIEKVARDLQRDNANTVKGKPLLECFFEGLCASEDPLPKRQSRVAAWKTARPNSALARIVGVQLWTDEAWHFRGEGEVDTITPAMQEGVNANVARGLANLQLLPKNAFESPLAFNVTLSWGQIASAPREFFDTTFAAGIGKFPDYYELYTQQEYLLMTRWYGKPGEMEALVARRADALGGERGDIFYARLVWSQISSYDNVWRDTAFSYPRFKRGMRALAKARPDSISVSNALLRGALYEDDFAVQKEFFTSPSGHIIDGSQWSAANRNLVPNLRMQALAH